MAKLYTENYLEIKKKLDGLNYSLPFDMSSCKLVETLVNDIYKLKTEVTKVLSEREVFRSKFDQSDLNFRAIEYENKRIAKENTQLHKEMIELSKKLGFSGNAKDLEIKRQNEEKNDLKFLLNETKTKVAAVERENVKLKTRISDVLVKIFDSNFSENNLRKLFNEHVFMEVKEGHLSTENDNLFNLNFDLISQENKKKEGNNGCEEITMAKASTSQPQMLEITLPKRTINMTQVLEPKQQFDQGGSINMGNYSQNTPYQQQTPYAQSTGIEQAMKNTFLKTADDLIVKASFVGNSNDADVYKNLNKKNEILIKQVEKLTNQLNEKQKEVMHVTRELEGTSKTTKSFDFLGGEKHEAVVKYLKEENIKLTTKYEERINFMIKENRALQDDRS